MFIFNNRCNVLSFEKGKQYTKRIYNFLSNLHSSFSLVEISVALAVMGVLGGGALTAYKATNPRLKSDLKKIQAIESALQQFFTTNGRLPFPAHPNRQPSDTDYLTECKLTSYNASQERYNCNWTNSIGNGTLGGGYAACAQKETHCCPGNFVTWGVVPTRALGLPDDYAYDSHGHNFEYITHTALTWSIGDPFDGEYKKTQYVTTDDGKYQILFISSDTSSINKSIPIERLSIYDNATAKEIATTKNNTAYVLISKGNTNKCYFNTRTKTINTTKPTGNLLKNCVQNYANDSTTNRTIYQGYSKSFDNIVIYKTLTELITRASTIQEDTRNLGGGIISNQLRVDSNLATESKEIVGAINEVNDKVKFVSTFKNVEGLREQLYYLTADEDNFTDKNGQKKHYRRGLYIYNENAANPSLSDFKLVSGASGGVPVGSVVAYSGTATTAPEGFLWCNGAKYNKLTYPELYQAIGETYTPASEKGGSTFRVPDLTDKIPWQSGSLSGSKAVGSEIAAGVPNITGTFHARPINSTMGSATGMFTQTFRNEINNSFSLGGGNFVGSIGEMKYTLNARSQNSIYGNSSTVQPPAISMKFMIRYTTDEDKAKEVFDFSEEVRKQLAQSIMAEEIQKAICEKSYPVGSVYISTKTGNPGSLLGCGTWTAVPYLAYLQNGKTDGSVFALNSWNDSQWQHNMLGKTTAACVPNLKGQVLRIQAERGQSNHEPTGVFSVTGWRGLSDGGEGHDQAMHIYFDASKYESPIITGGNWINGIAGLAPHGFNTVYLDGCTTVHPYSFTVLMWYRTA